MLQKHVNLFFFVLVKKDNLIELRSQKSLTSLNHILYTYFENKQIPATLSYLDFILYCNSKSYKYCSPYYIYKRIVGLLLLKDICGLIYT